MVTKGTVGVIERTLFVFSFAPKCPTCTDETGTFKGEWSALSGRKNRPFKNLHGSKNVQFFVTSCLTVGYKSRQKLLQNRPEVCFFRRNSVYNRLLSEKFIAYCPVRMNCRARSSWVSRPVALNICTGGLCTGGQSPCCTGGQSPCAVYCFLKISPPSWLVRNSLDDTMVMYHVPSSPAMSNDRAFPSRE